MASEKEVESGVNVDEFLANAEPEPVEENEESETIVEAEQTEIVEEEASKDEPKAEVLELLQGKSKKPETVPFQVFERERDKYKERAQKAEAELEKLRESQATPTEAEISGIFDENAEEDDFISVKQAKKLISNVDKIVEKKLSAKEQALQEAAKLQKISQLESQVKAKFSDYDAVIGKLSKLNLSESARQSIATAENPAEAAYQLGCELFGISQPQKVKQNQQQQTNADEVDDDDIFKEIYG